MADKENRPPPGAGVAPILSPNHNHFTGHQTEYPACSRFETPLRVRKTRENLRQGIYTDVPPSGHIKTSDSANHLCNSGEELVQDGNRIALAMPQQHNEPAGGTVDPRPQKSVSLRMLSKVKQGISNRSKATQVVRPIESESSLIRRLSGRRKQSNDSDRAKYSFEIQRKDPDGNFSYDRQTTSNRVESGGIENRRRAPDYSWDYVALGYDNLQMAAGSDFNGVHATTTSRSFTNSTLSTTATELSSCPQPCDSEPTSAAVVGRLTPPSTTPSPQPTPRPSKKAILTKTQTDSSSRVTAKIPCVALDVAIDRTVIDVAANPDIWIAVEAVIALKDSDLKLYSEHGHLISTSNPEDQYGDVHHSHRNVESMQNSSDVSIGTITSLRICYKPIGDCQVREIVGQKVVYDLQVGQTCTLFIKLHVPKINMRCSAEDVDQGSLLLQLESFVGSLETEVLHVEARYRHSMLPSDNVVAVRHASRVRRPDFASSWSLCELENAADRCHDVYSRLARYCLAQYPASRTLDLLQGYLSSDHLSQHQIREMVKRVEGAKSQEERVTSPDTCHPAVVITQSDVCSNRSNSEALSSANGPRIGSNRYRSTSAMLTPATPIATCPTNTSTTMRYSSTTTGPSTTTANGEHDRARELWRHLRGASLSSQQLEGSSSQERLQVLEANDANARELRRIALANKRSVGAETLKGWSWDDKILKQGSGAEAPWL